MSDAAQSAPAPAPDSERRLAEVIADHFVGARVVEADGAWVVELGEDLPVIECRIDTQQDHPPYGVFVFLSIRGGALGGATDLHFILLFPTGMVMAQLTSEARSGGPTVHQSDNYRSRIVARTSFLQFQRNAVVAGSRNGTGPPGRLRAGAVSAIQSLPPISLTGGSAPVD